MSNAGGNSYEQIGLTTMHILFVREHNCLAEVFKENSLGLSGDEIYYRVRRIVAAELQVIIYKDFLPVLLG